MAPKPSAIAEAIAKLQDPAVAAEMGRRAYETSRRFTWAAAVEAVEAALEAAGAHGPGRRL
ncbi:hypothetical protein D3C78_1960370 [compost metagenome]